MGQTRRDFLQGLAGAASLASVQRTPTTWLGDRAHIVVRPEVRERLTACLSTVLGCGAPATIIAPGVPVPILAFRFPGGGSISVEFSEEAADDAGLRRGAWLEVRTDDPAALRQRVVEAGLPRLTHPATPTFYFVLPGGQVLGIVAGTRA